MLECDACGARRPVKAVKKAAKVEEAPLVEGKVYELMIQDIGKKGDGIAKLDKYVIYVPGTAKGAIVKVYIEKIAGTVAFGRVTREESSHAPRVRVDCGDRGQTGQQPGPRNTARPV